MRRADAVEKIMESVHGSVCSESELPPNMALMPPAYLPRRAWAPGLTSRVALPRRANFSVCWHGA